MKSFILLNIIIFFLFPLPLAGQMKDPYHAQWEKIDSAEAKGLPRTARKIAKKIYIEATKDENNQQKVKALIYQLKYKDKIEEAGLVDNILQTDSIIQTESGVTKALLLNLSANLYLAYVQENRTRIRGRTFSTNEDNEKLTSWSLSHFYIHIDSLFQQSLENQDTLGQLKIKDFTLLIDSGKNSLHLRPTLFDLLAHNALDFYTKKASFFEQQASHYIIDEPEAFAQAKVFVQHVWSSPDDLSPILKTLKLYQRLIQLHRKKHQISALIDVDLNRLQYVYQNSVGTKKDSLYKRALRHIISNHAVPAKYEAVALLAKWYYQKGLTYETNKNTPYRQAFKKAVALCKKVPDKVVNSGSIQCRQIKDEILKPVVGLKVENVNLPQKPFRVLVSYKNESKLHFKIVALDDRPKSVFDQQLTLSTLLEKKEANSWQQVFPLPDDYQTHSAEMKVSALPPGRYALIASANSTFEKENSPIVYIDFRVSGLSYISDNHNGFLVLNRETGKPVKKAKVRLWKRVYNSSSRKYDLEKDGRYKTDRNGYFKISKDENSAYLMPEIKTKKDYLFLERGNYTHFIQQVSSEKKQKKSIRGELFTDRSIYRPGQEVHFKGIIYQHQSYAKNKVLKDIKIKIRLFDAHYQAIDSIELTSNDYGSIAGSFQLPSASLNGIMHIALDTLNTKAYFHVEAYKRPSFDLEWDSVASSYRLGDTVQVSGRLMGYNGVAIQEASIQYTVTRNRFLFPYYRRSLVFPIRKTIVSQGKVASGKKGSFSLSFPAIPDEAVPKGKRIFSYEIAADVTDRNGESHHYNYSIPIGDQSMLLHLNMDQKINNSQLDSLHLTSTDLDGNFISTPVAVSMYKLKAPEHFIRKRYWTPPDQFLMNEKAFRSSFPYDEYKNESDVKNWPIQTSIYVSTDTTAKNGKISFFYGHLIPGWYLIKATAKDQFGKFVTDSQYIQVYSTKAHSLSYPQALWINKDTIMAQAGKKVSWQVGSSERAYIFYKSENLRHRSPINRSRFNHRIKTIKYKVKKKDQGGLIRHYVTVLHNRIFTENIRINVPPKKKDLRITYETFRDKIRPGEKETWSVKIAGSGQKKIQAELLASMYDLSLDYFSPHRWNAFRDLYPTLTAELNWKGDPAFSARSDLQLYRPKKKTYPDYSVIYPRFRSFGYYMNKPAFHYFEPRSQMVLRQNKLMSSGVAKEKSFNDANESSSTPDDTAISPPLKIRKDFRETAFFYPQLHTDDSSNVAFSFTAPEALTRWKLMLLAHSKDLRFAYSQKEVVTQKPLMIQLNKPRFVRQGDALVLTAKLSNLSKKTLSGNTEIIFKNSRSGKNISIVQSSRKQAFTIEPGENQTRQWAVVVPEDYTDALTYTVKAHSGRFSDGEQDILPVLSNKVRLTESLPFYFKGSGTHRIQWKLLSSFYKNNQQPNNITIEYTGNPIWYVVQALPFLDQEKRESANVLFRKVYVNALSRYVALQIPNFKETMQQWLTIDSNALKSPLQKNEDLKNILLEETPWVQNARKEAEQKAEIAHWFKKEDGQLPLEAAIKELENLQLNNGGFSWFKGMPDNQFITQEIVTGLGHLKALHAWPHTAVNDLQKIIGAAIPYLDARMKEDYNKIKEKNDLKKEGLTSSAIQYLYMRSFFPDQALDDSVKTAYTFFYDKATKKWNTKEAYQKAQLVLVFHRKQDDSLAQLLLHSLAETAIKDKEGGIYWKRPSSPYRLMQQSPISMQATALEAFHALKAGKDTINAMRNWLINQKRTRFWETEKATADAIYGILLIGKDWTNFHPSITFQIGDTTFVWGENKKGLQYEKITLPQEIIQKNMENIRITIAGAEKSQPSWGALYVQYLEDMNQAEKAKGSDLHIERQISKEINNKGHKQLMPIDSSTILEVGDKVQVRLIIKADRDLDFVHLKDVRASSMEPVHTLSGYRWEDGLGFYTTTSDAAVHFYFQHIPKGTYVLTYPVYITQKGNFTGGLSQIESLYAPEMRAHSEGVRLEIR